ncbi:MAG: two-component regulator propeller domain-containing protein [Planctomycetota bacterium]
MLQQTAWLLLALLAPLGACATVASCDAQELAAPAPEQVPAALFQYPGAPFEASDGNLWFSTVGAGLVGFDGTNYVTFTRADGLAADSVRDILEDDEGRLMIATTGGVSRYEDGTFTTLTDYGDLEVTSTFTEDGDHRDVWDLALDRSGTLWITTLAGVFRHDGTRFVEFPLPVVAAPGAFEFTPKFVYSVMEAKDGALWFGTDGAGAVRYDGETTQVYTVKDHGLASDRVCTILEDGRGDLWFGTSDGGVSRYDGDSFTTHLESTAFSEHTGWGRYMAIHEDRAGDVWFGVASQGGGAYRWNGATFRYFSEQEGLNSSGIPSISEDRSGTLWFGTTTGVFRREGERFVALGR